MIETPRYLKNHESVVSIFGRWPSFHDADVRNYERTTDGVRLNLHTWEMTPETDDRGYFILKNHHLVQFEFSGIVESNLETFGASNILYELAFSPSAEYDATGKFTVTLDSVMGDELCGSFTATHGEVAAILPCDKTGQVIQTKEEQT